MEKLDSAYRTTQWPSARRLTPDRERQEPRYYSDRERCGCVSYEEKGWCRHTAGADRARYGLG